MTARRTKKKELTPQKSILLAMRATKMKFRYRTAQGLSKQTKIPLEHVEHYLIRLAQERRISVFVDHGGRIVGGLDLL